MTMLLPADPCGPAVRIPSPTAKTVREVAIEAQLAEAKQLLRACLPFVLIDTQPSGKTSALIERITEVVR